MKTAKIGIAPIAWWNDDDASLSDDVTLDEALRQAASAGFTGMETGRRFPMNINELGPILNKYDMSVCGGWFSGSLLINDIELEKDKIAAQAELFIAANAPCIVYGETARSIQGKKIAPLSTKNKLTEKEIEVYGRNISDFADWCVKLGMPIAYHHHMSAVIETEAELDLLMKHSSVPLLFDTGHMAMAGGDLLRVIDNHHKRIKHVHTKDVRQNIVDALDREKDSFLDAVIKGVFTVPGDGHLSFENITKELFNKGYEGWFVVEAEQDPVKNNPLKMAQIGHAELRNTLVNAGYEVKK